MEPAATTDDRQFRAWIGAGELRQAGEWLVRRHAGEVVGLCAAMVHDRNVAEDLAQDVFGRAFASLSGFRGDASPRTWLLSIARNRCIDHLRAHRRDPWRGPAHDDDGAEPDLHPDEAPLPPELLLRRDDVDRALGQLAEAERALVMLRFGHGLDYRELAEAFGLREGTVRMRISRAIARMRRALEQTEPHVLQTSLEAAPPESYVDGAVPEAADEAPERQRAPAPAAAPPRKSRVASRGRGGLLGRLGASFGGGGRPPRPPHPPHPLAEVLPSIEPPPSDRLLRSLLGRAQTLGP